jgi:hypothetical protein
VDFEFHPLGQAGGGGEAGEAHGFLGVHRAAGVGQEQVFFRVDEFEDVGVGVAGAAEVGAAQGDGDDLRAAGGERVAHGFVGREFPGAEEQAGMKVRPAMVRTDMEI